MLLETRAGIPPSDQPTSVFLALRPPREIAKQFYADTTKLCLSTETIGQQRPSSILHVTLLSLGGAFGRMPDRLLRMIDAAIGRVRYPAFDVTFDEAKSFETRQASVPFVLEGEELTDIVALRLAARDALHVKDVNVPARRDFRPHMTIAYARRRCPRTSVAPFSWRAREFQLVESWTGKTKYVELARWTLWESAPPCSGCPAQPALHAASQPKQGEDGAAYVT